MTTIPEPRARLARALVEKYGTDWQGIMSIAARTNYYCRRAVSLSVNTDEEADMVFGKVVARITKLSVEQASLPEEQL